MFDEPKDKLPLQRLRREEEEKIAQKRAQDEGYRYLNLATVSINHDAVIMISEDEAKQAKAAIIQKIGKRIEVAIYSSRLSQAQTLLERLKKQGYSLDVFMVSESSLKKAWQAYETYVVPRESLKEFVVVKQPFIEQMKPVVNNKDQFQQTIRRLSLSGLLEFILIGAFFSRASDIHLEPQAHSVKLRYRIDGVLHDIAELEQKHYDHLLSRIKILSGLKINIHDTNQDGRFSLKLELPEKGVKKIDLRVSILPGPYGETIVMRLLGVAVAKLSIDNLGIRPDVFSLVKIALEKPHGLILTTGPTGSGKTTTLYSFLNYIKKPEINIITIEDPIEYMIPGITQSQVSVEEGYTFAQALRAVVRQDPDVILVGEIRDRETADTAIQAALTGHLVLSTVHTNDAAGAIPRLRDLGADEKSLTAALNLVIAQRLVRKLCPYCKEAYDPSEEERRKIEKTLSSLSKEKVPSLEKLYRPKGCDKCMGLGYWDRIGIFEIFAMTPEMEKLIINRATHSEILSFLNERGFITMKQDGYLKVLEGITDISEVDRVT